MYIFYLNIYFTLILKIKRTHVLKENKNYIQDSTNCFTLLN